MFRRYYVNRYESDSFHYGNQPEFFESDADRRQTGQRPDSEKQQTAVYDRQPARQPRTRSFGRREDGHRCKKTVKKAPQGV